MCQGSSRAIKRLVVLQTSAQTHPYLRCGPVATRSVFEHSTAPLPPWRAEEFGAQFSDANRRQQQRNHFGISQAVDKARALSALALPGAATEQELPSNERISYYREFVNSSRSIMRCEWSPNVSMTCRLLCHRQLKTKDDDADGNLEAGEPIPKTRQGFLGGNIRYLEHRRVITSSVNCMFLTNHRSQFL